MSHPPPPRPPRGSPWEVVRLFGGQWKTADFAPGDILTFSMRTLHMSTTNTTNRVRLSADVRWQPAAEPADPRYVGDVETYLKQMSKAGAWNTDEDVKAAAGGEEGAASEEEAGRGSGTARPQAEARGVKELEKQRVTIEQLRERWGFPVAAAAPHVGS